jgi:hypothetical protein
MVRCLFIRCRLDSALKLLKHDPQMKLANVPKELANCATIRSGGDGDHYWKFARGAVGCPSSWGVRLP